MITVIYMLALLGACFIAGQSHITLRARRFLSRFVAVNKPPEIGAAVHRCEWEPHPQFGAPRCDAHNAPSPHFAISYWYPFKWPLMLVECPACLSTWIGAAVAWWWPELAHAAGGLMGGVVPFALFSCGSSAFLSFLVGLTSGDDHV